MENSLTLNLALLSKPSLVITGSSINIKTIKQKILETEHGDLNNFYFTHNGKLVKESDDITGGVVYAVPRLVGGKGGFGSMLRAIGAQIEKTTNREACRDLSGRRLRDINEEKRLKNWIAQQQGREEEAAERRKKRLERLCAEPKHNFKDETYDQERSELTEKVSDAVDQGFKASASKVVQSTHVGAKRKMLDSSKAKKKKKTCLWMDADEEDLSSSIDTDDSSDEGVGATMGRSPAACKATTGDSGCDSKPETDEGEESQPLKAAASN